MTYGWMLLVVAIVGGAIFAVVQSESVESVSGFTGADVQVEDFGITSSDELELVLRNAEADTVTVESVNVSDGDGRFTEFTDETSIGVGSTDTVTLANVSEGESGANNLDVTVNFGVGGLENLQVSGTISGSLELTGESSTVSNGENGEENGGESLSEPESGGDWSLVEPTEVEEGYSYFFDTEGEDSEYSDGFFVMTYEARDDGGDAVSEAEGEPWTNIDYGDSMDECQALDAEADDYEISLITNREWMTVARQVERQSENWADGEIGSSIEDGGGLVRGWSADTDRGDDWDNNDPAPDSTSSNLYNVGEDDGDSSGDELYRRTHVLASGDQIWDFSGNVWQWVDVTEDPDNPEIEGGIYGGSNQYLEDNGEFEYDWAFNDAGDERYELGPSDTSYGEDQGLGYVWNNDQSDRVLRRGGAWFAGPRAGPFASTSNTDASTTYSHAGFRCSAVPAS